MRLLFCARSHRAYLAGRTEAEKRVLQDKIDALLNSKHALLRAVAHSVRALGYVRRFLFNPRIRSENLTRVLHRDAHLQGATYSEPDRYPELFAACATYLKQIPGPTILSFGCATGEEAFSLAQLLPNATIIAVDINRWCLTQARKANHYSRIHFLHTSSPEFATLANLDAIFAMAVFQRSQNRTHTAPLAHRGFPFAAFDQQIARLDAKLKPGGLFFIDHADFRFEDTAAAAHYTPLECEGSRFVHDRPLFGPHNRLIATQYTMQRVFQKHSTSVG
jgi:tRNA1(Val) A37 N6-methylase TrmN6